MLESLLPGVRDLSLQPVDRLGLQNDLFSLVSPKLVPTEPVPSHLVLNSQLHVSGLPEDFLFVGVDRKPTPLGVNKGSAGTLDLSGWQLLKQTRSVKNKNLSADENLPRLLLWTHFNESETTELRITSSHLFSIPS